MVDVKCWDVATIVVVVVVVSNVHCFLDFVTFDRVVTIHTVVYIGGRLLYCVDTFDKTCHWVIGLPCHPHLSTRRDDRSIDRSFFGDVIFHHSRKIISRFSFVSIYTCLSNRSILLTFFYIYVSRNISSVWINICHRLEIFLIYNTHTHTHTRETIALLIHYIIEFYR